MGKAANLIGKKFGNLEVLEKAEYKPDSSIWWICKCQCGNLIMAPTKVLTSGRRKSCGCLLQKAKQDIKHQLNKRWPTSHSATGSRLYRIWWAMKTRCYNPKHKNYHCYGGRGIMVCDDWLHNFSTFQQWSLDNGYRDNLTIDRIDVNGNYEPSNCRWTTIEMQQQNKRKL